MSIHPYYFIHQFRMIRQKNLRPPGRHLIHLGLGQKTKDSITFTPQSFLNSIATLNFQATSPLQNFMSSPDHLSPQRAYLS